MKGLGNGESGFLSSEKEKRKRKTYGDNKEFELGRIIIYEQ